MKALPPAFIPPSNEQAEEIVIGSVLADYSVIKKTSITIDDFYYDKFRSIWSVFAEMESKKIPIDLSTILDYINQDSISVASEAASKVATLANFSYYEDLVKENAIRRRLQRIYITAASEIDRPIDDTIAHVRDEMSAATSRRSMTLVSAREVAKEISVFVERRSGHSGKISGITSGLRDIDSVTDGWQDGDMIILAGRPGSGKSAFAWHLIQAAASSGKTAGFISLEMGSQQIGIRALSSMSEIEMWKLRKGHIYRDDWNNLYAAAAKMSALPIWFTFSSMDYTSINRSITAMVQDKGCRIIAVDYLQLARVDNEKSREREVSKMSQLLKTCAKLHKIPVLPLAQLNRSMEKEQRKPRLSDLRESGSIEQDADVVMFLYQKDREESVVEIMFEKGRNIGLQTVRVQWDRETMVFRDLIEVPDMPKE